MNFSFVLKLYFSSASNYAQYHYKFLSCIKHFLSTSKLNWWCHAFLQERIQKSSPRALKKACAILKGRAQKDVFPSTQKKMEVEAKKLKKNDFRCTSAWNKKVSYLCVCSRTHWCDTMSVSARNYVRDTTFTTLFFIFFYFHWSYYNKYFVRYLQIKSSLVLLTNYFTI